VFIFLEVVSFVGFFLSEQLPKHEWNKWNVTIKGHSLTNPITWIQDLLALSFTWRANKSKSGNLQVLVIKGSLKHGI